MKASFDPGKRVATAEYAYRYDRGQVLEVYGIEGIDEPGVTVSMHYGLSTDANTVSEAVTVDGDTLRAKVPDTILQHNQEAHAYIYISKGTDMARTLYEVIFTPIDRPAPSDTVPEEVSNEWDTLKAEVQTQITQAGLATNRANAAAASLEEEIDGWEARLQAVEARVPGSMVQELKRLTLTVGADGWSQEGGLWEKTVSAAGTIANSQTQRVRYGVAGSQIGKVMLAGCRVDEDGTLTLICLTQPQAAFELDVSVEAVVKAGL